jgi:hypothetical protein
MSVRAWRFATLLFAAVSLTMASAHVLVADAIREAPASVPSLWMQLQLRWEGGHAAGFVLQLAGFSCLLGSVLIETPPDGERVPGP